ncbi:MAG: iron-containing alcohol dehydrogenase [Thermoproteales archaeon]|nr:iron-containing alcohol dehydrogenase [Thermoproteales archaeon]
MKEASELAVKEECDLIIGLGGGSSLDVAKFVAAVAAGESEVDELIRFKKIIGYFTRYSCANDPRDWK